MEGFGRAAGVDWSVAIELASAMRRVASHSKRYADHAKATGDLTWRTHEQERVGDFCVKSAGPAVLVEIREQRWFECNYKDVPSIASAITKVARELEELHKADQIADDAAFLSRVPILGQRVGLTANPLIQREAFKRAEYLRFDRMLKRPVILRPPSIIQHPPKQLATE
jgi:hypothetical protein